GSTEDDAQRDSRHHRAHGQLVGGLLCSNLTHPSLQWGAQCNKRCSAGATIPSFNEEGEDSWVRPYRPWIDHVDWTAAGVSDNLLEDVRELHLVLVAGDVTDVWRANDIFHAEKRMSRVEHWLLFIDIDRCHSRPARFECSTEGAVLNQSGPAGVDQDR